jgi:DNA ligase-1
MMSTPDQIIRDLEIHNSRINKEQIILAAAEDGNDEFFAGVRLALDPLITFGLKKIPEKTDTSGSGLDWDTFSLIITGFVSRNLTGNTARDVVADLMRAATQAQWNDWYRRILIKDLRCGVSEKTVNKVVEKRWPNWAVPVFGCQLAHDSNNHESKVSGQKYIETKLDGVRVITIVYPEGRVDQFSRNGKELVNFEHIKAQFLEVCGDLPEPWVFDGEVMSSSFQDLMRQVHRKENVRAQDAVLHLFDSLPLATFEQGQWSATQEYRSGFLRSWYDTHQKSLPNIRILEQELIDLDTDAGQKRFNEINRLAIEGGFEGIMIKDPQAIYECKRTASWLKLKPWIEVSLTVVETEEGTGKNAGRMGALVCEGLDDGRHIRVNVGSGFTDQQREDFWNCRADGYVVEVRADAVTQNQDGSYSLRFPRFLRFRGFNLGEKL